MLWKQNSKYIFLLCIYKCWCFFFIFDEINKSNIFSYIVCFFIFAFRVLDNGNLSHIKHILIYFSFISTYYPGYENKRTWLHLLIYINQKKKKVQTISFNFSKCLIKMLKIPLFKLNWLIFRSVCSTSCISVVNTRKYKNKHICESSKANVRNANITSFYFYLCNVEQIRRLIFFCLLLPFLKIWARV